MPEPEVVLSGLGIPESPRWHEGRLWFCNWIDRQVVAVDLDGTAEVMLIRDPASHPMGYSIDWLPDGRLLTTGAKLERQEPDGSMVTIAEQHANEIVVDAGGNAYVNGADFDFVAGAPPEPGDRRVFADGLGPDGITMDAEGAVWVSAGGFSVIRVAEGGRILQRVALAESRAPFALMLGGPDRQTLFICTAEWRLADGHVANLERLVTGPRTGQILALPVEVPGTGRP
jgi:sugar lactone lactonase YvrE